MIEVEVVFAKIRKERDKAWERASIMAKYADRLETALLRISECPCVEQYTCAERAIGALEYSKQMLHEELEIMEANNELAMRSHPRP